MAAKFAKSEQLANLGTIATTSTTDDYLIAPATGYIVDAVFSGLVALAAHGSNYLTFTITNLGQAGSGTAEVLAAADSNTTKTTTGAAIAANTARTLVLTSTGADRAVVKGDRLRIRATATGTLANTVTASKVLVRYEWSI